MFALILFTALSIVRFVAQRAVWNAFDFAVVADNTTQALMQALMQTLPQHNSDTLNRDAPTPQPVRYTHGLCGERIPLPPHVTPLPMTQAVIEQAVWERERREREQELLSGLLIQMRRRAGQRRRCARVFMASGLVSVGMGLLMLVSTTPPDALTPPFLLACLTAFVAAVVGTLLHVQMTSIVTHLPLGDVRAIGPLLEALHYADMEGIPQRALAELLPCLVPADAVLFSDSHRHNLHRALNEANTDLVIQTLKALERIGDGRSVAPVARLATGKGSARYNPDVLYAALHCLPILEARAVYDGENQTLLRAATVPLGANAELLRAVEEPPDPRAHTLLRPSARVTPT